MPMAPVLPSLGLSAPALHKHVVQAAKFGVDAAILTGALLLATGLRLDLPAPAEHWATALLLLPLVLGVQLTALAPGSVSSLVARIGRRITGELVPAAQSPAATTSANKAPISPACPQPGKSQDGERILLVGAGQAGIAALQTMQRSGDGSFHPLGFIDIDPARRGQVVEGLPVHGTLEDLPQLIWSLAVEHVFITLDGASRREIRRVVELCERIHVKVRVIPALLDLLAGNVETTVRSVDIEALLGRDPVVLEQAQLTSFLAGKQVLVTGAGGSIGSELCRQIARFAPASLILVERCEFALWAIERELHASFPGLNLLPRLADVGDRSRMREIFGRERPQVVLHAAAHKHVPLVESNPCEAVKNNILGTRTTAELAGEFGAETFVLVSTDKAVRPTSMMGATKRVAEQVIQRLNGRHATKYLAVRFGNVLGSTGSVVPIFREQIARGGPVTITHPDMVRFFMTIPEAAQLVLQAGALQAGGEIYVLDMGEPVKIVDLARQMIAQCGLKPDDIEIQFTGMRPGEKMYEELSTDDEVLARTRHPKILSGQLSPQRPELERDIEALAILAERGDEAGARRQLARMLPESQLTLLGGPAAPAAVMNPNESMTAVSA